MGCELLGLTTMSCFVEARLMADLLLLLQTLKKKKSALKISELHLSATKQNRYQRARAAFFR